MRNLRVVIACILLSIGSVSILFGVEPLTLQQNTAAYPDPSRFEKAIQAFEAASKETSPPEGAIVGIGSSSMLMWTTIQEDLTPLTIIHRGFGGSTMNDALYFADRIVMPYHPRAVLLYEGDNDVALGISPQQINETFDALVTKIHQALPKTRIYVLAIKPSILRWNLWDTMKSANERLKETCDADDLMTFIDVATPMLDETGAPRTGIFLQDNLHMNDTGYRIWKEVVRPVLMQQESIFEQ